MRTIITLNMNPAIDKSTTTEHVIAERKLYCRPAAMSRVAVELMSPGP